MTTTIDNNQRKFLVQSVGFGNTFDIFCNLKDLPQVIKENVPTNTDYRVFEYWNRKLRRCGKKHLNEMFVANRINFCIK